MCGVRGPVGLSIWDVKILELVKEHAPGLSARIGELLQENSKNLDKIFDRHDSVVNKLTKKIKELNNG